MNRIPTYFLTTRNFFGIILLLIPLAYQVLWIRIFSLHSNHAERVADFTRFLPPLLKDPRQATWFFLACCILSVLLMAVGVTHKNLAGKIISVAVIILASLLSLLLLFSMM